jgi:hypothetical protein
LTVALAQAPSRADFLDELRDAEQFYDEHLSGSRLSKQASFQTSAKKVSVAVPSAFALHPAYPNPFGADGVQPQTRLRFDLPQESRVAIRVFNTLGRQVRSLVTADLAAGSFELLWDGRDAAGRRLASGVYLVVMEAETGSAGRVERHVVRRKVLLLR